MDKNSIIKTFEPRKDNMLNILHALQNNNPQNYLTSEDLKLVANYLNVTYSSVYGVAKYYSMLSLKPRGKYIIRVCKSPVCHMIGNKKIFDEIKDSLHISPGETSEDLMFTVEKAECLGQCDKAPSLMINDKIFVDLDKEKIKDILQTIHFNEHKTK